MKSHHQVSENLFPHLFGGNYVNLYYPAILKVDRVGESVKTGPTAKIRTSGEFLKPVGAVAVAGLFAGFGHAHGFGDADAEAAFLGVAEDHFLRAGGEGDLEIEEALAVGALIDL